MGGQNIGPTPVPNAAYIEHAEDGGQRIDQAHKPVALVLLADAGRSRL